MTLQFAFRHMDSSEAIKELVTKKMEKLGKIVDYPLEFHVTLSADKLQHTAEITCRAEHQAFSAKATTEDLYASIDDTIHKLETQLKKEREKRKGHQAAHQVSRNGDILGGDIPADLPHAGKASRGK
jgi:putative sigma-54 modulation protein